MTPRRLALSALIFLACTAHADQRDDVRDDRGTPVIDSNGHCVRTMWMDPSDPCAPPPPVTQQVVTERRVHKEIAKEDRTVYFDFNKTALTADSQQRLNSLAATLKSDQDVKEARIFGYADRIGTISYNDRLSQKRAEVVREYLISQGFVNSRVTETRWFGESVPKTNCPDSLARPELIECLQKDRRVEVEIDYLPENNPSTNP